MGTRSPQPLRGTIRGLEVVAIAASLGPAGEDHQREEETEGEDSDRPPEGSGVAVNCRGVSQAGGVQVDGRVTGGGAGEDRAEQGGADRAADLLGGVDHRRGDPGFTSFHPLRRGRERRREDASHPDAEDEQARNDIAAIARAGRQAREHEHPDDPERHADKEDRLDPGVLDHAGLHGGRRDDENAGQGEERQSGGERREAELLLQEVGEKQKNGKDARGGERDRGVCAATRPVPDDVQRQQRMLCPALDQHERRQEHGAGGERHDRRRRRPRVSLGV